MAIDIDRIINPGTDYEFSISESIADLITQGKFIESELSAYMTCGYIDNRVQGIVTPNLSLSQMGDYIDSCMFVPSAVTGFSADYSWNKQFPSNFQYYKRNLLVYSEAGINNGQYITDQDYSKWFIVLDIDIKKFYLKDNFRTTNTISGYTYTDSNGESVEIYGSYNNTEYQCLWQDDNTATNLFVIGLSIINGKIYFYMDNPHNQAYPKPLNSCAIWYDGGIKGGTGGEFISDVTGATDISFMPVLDGLPDYTNGQENQTPSQEYISGFTNSNGEFFGLNKSGHGSAYYDATSIAVRDNQIGARITKGMRLAEIFAWAGFKFKFKNTWYKPIISGGIVTGYTDDMSQESEWDDMTNVTGNTVPSGPPTPPIPPGYDDDPWNGVSFSGVGVGGAGAFAKCYYMTSTELANLRTWMSGVGVPEGFDPMAQIIGLSQVPVALSGDAPETVTFINSSAVYDPGVTSRVVDSGVSTQQAMGTPIKYSLGSVDISRRMQERGEPYLDYDCQVELYLPLVGVFSLDTQAVMGRSIEAEAILDPISGTLAAYAWVSKDGQKLPVAYGSTTIGVDLPISAQQYSVAKAALKQANAQLGTALLSSALTMIASASASGKASQGGGRSGVSASGIQQAGNNSFSQAAGIAASQTMVSQTGNVFGAFMDWGRTIRQLSYGNNTAIAGSFGGSSAQWSYPFQAYVKIIRPRFVKPDNYAHTQGVPCVQAKKIKNCTGFIQCIGVDVINIAGATDLERQVIQAALSSGIYAGGGQ